MALIPLLLATLALGREVSVEVRVGPGESPPVFMDADGAIPTRVIRDADTRIQARLDLPATLDGVAVPPAEGAAWQRAGSRLVRTAEHRMIEAEPVPLPSAAWLASLWGAVLLAGAWAVRSGGRR